MDYLNLLKNRIDLDRIPFTERDSRLMLFKQGDCFKLTLAESTFERNPITPITNWRFHDVDGDINSWPHRIDFEAITFAFFDDETLLVSLPAGRINITFTTLAEAINTDRRGAVISLRDQHPAYLVYTTDARIDQQDVSDVEDGTTQIHLRLDAAADAVLLINISRTKASKRWIPDAGAVIERNAQRWRDRSVIGKR